jgi:hypothetical protein
MRYTQTPTPSHTATPSNTPSDTPTMTPTSTICLGVTPSPTGTQTPTPTMTPTQTKTPGITQSMTPTQTGTPTMTPTSSAVGNCTSYTHIASRDSTIYWTDCDGTPRSRATSRFSSYTICAITGSYSGGAGTWFDNGPC